MATLIHPDGTEIDVAPSGEDGSVTFSLAELYKHLECDMVQVIALPDGREMWCDEEARLREPEPPVNAKATALYAAAGGIPGAPVLGRVLVASHDETNDADEN